MCALNLKVFWKRFHNLSGQAVTINHLISSKTGIDAANEFANELMHCLPENVSCDAFCEVPNNSIWNDFITYDDVLKSIRSLKSGGDDTNFVRPDFLKLFEFSLVRFLTDLFNLFLSHSFTPVQFSFSTMKTLLKAGKDDVSAAEIYRLISSMSTFAKLYEYIFLDQFSRKFKDRPTSIWLQKL